MDILEDKRSECLSLVFTTTVGVYMDFIESVYVNRGSIEGQRSPLKTKTAIRIRKRMISDLCGGALLPPIVLGATIKEDEIAKVESLDTDESAVKYVISLNKSYVSIIDGMQRTTALKEALKISDIRNNPLRLEVWISKSTNSLIYRMLVLNTGQIPWDIKRQLETVYSAILEDLKAQVSDLSVLSIDEKNRRAKAGQFQASRLVQFFLAFTSRKVNVDIKEQIAADFARLDATEATAKSDFLSCFIKTVSLLVSLDKAFEKCDRSTILTEDNRFKSGKDIFTSAPAGISFMAAVSIYVYGKPGFELDEKSSENLENVERSIQALISKIGRFSTDQLSEFLQLVELNERLGVKVGKVGEFERDFFLKAFTTLIEEGDKLPSMSPCWAAY